MEVEASAISSGTLSEAPLESPLEFILVYCKIKNTSDQMFNPESMNRDFISRITIYIGTFRLETRSKVLQSQSSKVTWNLKKNKTK